MTCSVVTNFFKTRTRCLSSDKSSKCCRGRSGRKKSISYTRCTRRRFIKFKSNMSSRSRCSKSLLKTRTIRLKCTRRYRLATRSSLLSLSCRPSQPIELSKTVTCNFSIKLSTWKNRLTGLGVSSTDTRIKLMTALF